MNSTSSRRFHLRLSRAGILAFTRSALALFAAAIFVLPALAQVIRVVAALSHSTNSIRPTEAVGAGIDRLPYAAQRPDGQWALMIVNKDQENPQKVRIVFDDGKGSSTRSFDGALTVKTVGKAQYQWHPLLDGGTADPDGPIASSTMNASKDAKYVLPAASITVLRGNVK